MSGWQSNKVPNTKFDYAFGFKSLRTSCVERLNALVIAPISPSAKFATKAENEKPDCNGKYDNDETTLQILTNAT